MNVTNMFSACLFTWIVLIGYLITAGIPWFITWCLSSDEKKWNKSRQFIMFFIPFILACIGTIMFCDATQMNGILPSVELLSTLWPSLAFLSLFLLMSWVLKKLKTTHKKKLV